MAIPDAVLDIVRVEAAAEVPERVAAIADAARDRHGDGVAAVLAYGSALRERDDATKMVDLYLLARGYAEAGQGRWLSLANRLLPPNVYYLETDFAGRKVRSKYAMVSLDQLETLVGPRTLHPYFWARFAQPTALVWANNEETAEQVRRILAQAILTLTGEAWPLTEAEDPPEARWVRAFSETYRTELRAEGPERARELYRAHAARYDAIAAELRAEAGKGLDRGAALRRWRNRRIVGKALSVLRLLKAAFTFQDGASYLAAKIEQHSGVPVALTDWQRRHPILASGGLAWRLYRQGAFR
ncbi:MAG TPA: hypothetical protein VLR47_08580 [Rhodospirillales bacterium]|nr:hypothetical protein [Rhodospirillales bacterium]